MLVHRLCITKCLYFTNSNSKVNLVIDTFLKSHVITICKSDLEFAREVNLWNSVGKFCHSEDSFYKMNALSNILVSTSLATCTLFLFPEFS